MLEVEVAANAVYQSAAERIVERRQAELGRTVNRPITRARSPTKPRRCDTASTSG
jgi:hypothetical protein